MRSFSHIACQVLSSDLPRQDEFTSPLLVNLNFGDDAMSVDGKMNFAESSNVILKNSCLAALWSAATGDMKFFHPRVLLMDNIEDKGMEDIRSHNFQSLLVELSTRALLPHQIILKTSTINPVLDNDKYVIGPRYSRANRTLILT